MLGRMWCRVVWALVALLVCRMGLAQAPKTVVINEFMASNSRTLADAGQYEDWIELYNTSSQPVDVGGMYLTDDLTDPTKWRFPKARPLGPTVFYWFGPTATRKSLDSIQDLIWRPKARNWACLMPMGP